jgi:hypothetical protein
MGSLKILNFFEITLDSDGKKGRPVSDLPRGRLKKIGLAPKVKKNWPGTKGIP